MLFSEKMKQIPQPDRAALWDRYRTLCTALALEVRLRKEQRTASEEELHPLKQAAAEADALLGKHGFPPSFRPEDPKFFVMLTEELHNIANSPREKD